MLYYKNQRCEGGIERYVPRIARVLSSDPQSKNGFFLLAEHYIPLLYLKRDLRHY